MTLIYREGQAMYDSDKKYLSRFALDPDMEYGSEELYGNDFSLYAAYDDDPDPEDLILKDDFLFEK
jgi:hypothetical protein